MPQKGSEAPDQAVKDVTIPEALKIAVQMHRTGQSGTARVLLERVLAVVPDHPDALHFLGIVRWALGEEDAGIALVERSVAMQPEMTDWRNNLANMLLRNERIQEAKDLYQRVVEDDPQHANAWTNLGLVERLLDNSEAAEAAYREALRAAPDHADCHLGLAKLLFAERRVEEATVHLYRAIAIDPRRAGGSRALLSRAYFTLGEKAKAIKVIEDWLAEEPENPAAKHYLAALSDTPPERAADEYIETVFDEYADNFDSSLARLGYRAPEVIAAMLTKLLGDRSGLSGLDAGCGTGLLGPLVAHHFQRLDGVDLSSRMLAKAKKRTVYSALRHAELTADIAAHSTTYDVILSADTLIYFGALEDVAEAVRTALKPGGHLLFSVERDAPNAPGPGYRLQPHGRYCHSEAYLRDVLETHGFTIIEIAEDQLRRESGAPVMGYIVVARRN